MGQRTTTIGIILLATITIQESHAVEPLFGKRPLWTSGSTHCGGDGNAQLLDVDQDGDLDLVTSVPNPRHWAVYRNERGKLSSRPVWNSRETTDCDHISVLDFNHDGLADLAATHESHCTLYINQPRENGQRFAALPDWETGIYIDANQIDFGDFDQDGDLDMLMAAGLPFYGVAIFENQNGYPSKQPSQRVGIREYSESSIFADVDGDQDLDIVATYPKKGTVVIHRNVGGKFDDGTQVYESPIIKHCQRAYAIDLDKDGASELYLAKGPWGPPGASIALAQTASGVMKEIWKSARDTGYHGFDFADVDNDGDLDLGAADWSGRRVCVYLSENGKLPKTPNWTASTKGQAHELDFGDLDGDGDLDLAAGCLDQAYVFENLTND